MKSFILKSFVFVLIFSMISSVCFANNLFTDLAEDDWAYDNINMLYQRQIISGDAEGTLRPDANISREEVAKLIVGARKYELEYADAPIDAPDVYYVSDWAFPYVLICMEKGIISGYEDGSIKPQNFITRAEMVAFIVKSLNAQSDSVSSLSFGDVTNDDWYCGYVECAKTLGIVNGNPDGNFEGEKEVTRREAFVMISRMVNLLDILENK